MDSFFGMKILTWIKIKYHVVRTKLAIVEDIQWKVCSERVKEESIEYWLCILRKQALFRVKWPGHNKRGYVGLGVATTLGRALWYQVMMEVVSCGLEFSTDRGLDAKVILSRSKGWSINNLYI